MQTNVRSLTLAAFGAFAGTLTLAAAPRAADAQWYQSPAFDARPIHFGISGGLAVPTGSFANDFNTGWNVGGNVAVPLGYKSPVWIQADFNYAQFGASNSFLNTYGATNGYEAMASGTLNLVVNLVQSYGRRPAPITPYLIGGGGFYSRYVQLTNYTLSGCDPYFGCGFYGSNYTYQSRTETVGGWDAGAGVRFVMRPVRLFIEARYNSAITDRTTGFVPISVGVEW
jgi:hypothetical protein